jgi:hypothetical protein
LAKAAQSIARLFYLMSQYAGLVQAQMWRLVSSMLNGVLPSFIKAADEMALNPTWSVSHE